MSFVSEYRKKHDRCMLPVSKRCIDEETLVLLDIDLRCLDKEKNKRVMVFKAKERKTKKMAVFTIKLPTRSLKAGGVISASIRQFIIQGFRLNEAKKAVLLLVKKHNKNHEKYKKYFN